MELEIGQKPDSRRHRTRLSGKSGQKRGKNRTRTVLSADVWLETRSLASDFASVVSSVTSSLSKIPSWNGSFQHSFSSSFIPFHSLLSSHFSFCSSFNFYFFSFQVSNQCWWLCHIPSGFDFDQTYEHYENIK